MEASSIMAMMITMEIGVMTMEITVEPWDGDHYDSNGHTIHNII